MTDPHETNPKAPAWLKERLHDLYLRADTLTAEELDHDVQGILERWAEHDEKSLSPELRAERAKHGTTDEMDAPW